MTTPTDTPATYRTIHELRNYDGPLYVANLGPTLVTCHEQIGEKRVDFELDPAGGEDSIIMMPKLALEARGIQKLWIQGKIAISTDPSMEDKITLLINQNIKAPQERIDAIMARSGESTSSVQLGESIEAKATVVRPCAECGFTNPTTGVVERGQVFQSAAAAKEGAVPLCDVHTSMATEFTPRLVSVDDNGVSHWAFDKVSLTAPVRGH